MSWQSYVDDQLLAAKVHFVFTNTNVKEYKSNSQTVSKAAIAGHDGNVWATSEGFAATAAELKVNKNVKFSQIQLFGPKFYLQVIISNMGSPDVFAMNGVRVGGKK